MEKPIKHKKGYKQETKRKNTNRRFTTQKERDYLRNKFLIHQQPNRKMIASMAEELSWPRQRIARWFSNQRARTPLQSKLLEEIETQKQIVFEQEKMLYYSIQNSIDQNQFLKWLGGSLVDLQNEIKIVKQEFQNRKMASNSLMGLENKVMEIEKQLNIQKSDEEQSLGYLNPKKYTAVGYL
eukprot:Anaeramoba_flamelloidesa595807_10.p1 GENE.a595807_10~~a595807_10.p1  ORF type:complete len:182 (-),score=52.54 a595807_10:71-616(-)